MIAMITSPKLEPKLLSLRVMSLYKAFYLAQKLWRKLKGVRRRGLETL